MTGLRIDRQPRNGGQQARQGHHAPPPGPPRATTRATTRHHQDHHAPPPGPPRATTGAATMRRCCEASRQAARGSRRAPRSPSRPRLGCRAAGAFRRAQGSRRARASAAGALVGSTGPRLGCCHGGRPPRPGALHRARASAAAPRRRCRALMRSTGPSAAPWWPAWPATRPRFAPCLLPRRWRPPRARGSAAGGSTAPEVRAVPGALRASAAAPLP